MAAAARDLTMWVEGALRRYVRVFRRLQQRFRNISLLMQRMLVEIEHMDANIEAVIRDTEEYSALVHFQVALVVWIDKKILRLTHIETLIDPY
jgi:hypothetical protein